MVALSEAQRVLVQFKLFGPMEVHSFPAGMRLSKETPEESAMRRTRRDGPRGEMLEFPTPVSANFIRNRLIESGLVLTQARAQERLGKPKTYTVVSFDFNRVGDRLDQTIDAYLDRLAMRFWTKHYGFFHGELLQINIRFEMEGIFPKHFAPEEANEFGVARIRNTTLDHKRRAREHEAVAA